VTQEHASDGRWLRQLRDRAQDWLVRTGGLVGFVEKDPGKGRGKENRNPRAIPMGAYADLIFSFGLARLGCREEALELMRLGGAQLTDAGSIHNTLAEAYVYRISLILTEQSPSGRLPAEMRERIRNLDHDRPTQKSRYAVDRARAASRILEPDVRVNPYRFVMLRVSPPGDLKATDLTDEAGPEELRDRIGKLLAAGADGASGRQRRAAVLMLALGQALWAGREFAAEILDQALPAYDAARPSMEPLERAWFLTAALSASSRYALRDCSLPLVARVRELLQEARDTPYRAFGFDGWFRGLHAMGLRAELESLLGDVAERLREPDAKTESDPKAQCMSMEDLLTLAVGRSLLGQVAAAESLIEEARAYLFASNFEGLEKAHLASAYAAAVACSPDRAAKRARTEELFARLEGVEDTFSTMEYFSQSRIQFLEAVVLAATAPPAADEALVVSAR
jgi:hypothetical protein